MAQPSFSQLPWFDAHLDLAYLAEQGRDMHVPPAEARGRLQPAAITLPSLAEGGVEACLATVFTEAVGPDHHGDAPTGYPESDAGGAYRAGMRQLKLYQAWRAGGVMTALDDPGDALRVGVLVENADPIPGPGELGPWLEGGVRAIGLTWARRGRYACGNAVSSDDNGAGLTELGRGLLDTMERTGVALDISHLNDRSLAQALHAFGGRVMASHSNARALLEPQDQRHLTDETIASVAERGGVIGLNLCGSFLTSENRPATVDDCVRHIEHVCNVAGDRTHVGLGSDMDGGFAADRLPDGIRSPAGLVRLAEALHDRGWSDDEIHGFAWGNWSRFWGLDA